MSTEPVIVTQLLDANVSQVWKALTDINEVKAWYFPLEEFSAEPGFKFQFYGGEEGGPQYLHLCEITEVEPEKKLTYSWRYDGMKGISYVSWKLEEQGSKTLLTITHTGIESFAEGGKAFAKDNFIGGWTYFAEQALKNHLDK